MGRYGLPAFCTWQSCLELYWEFWGRSENELAMGDDSRFRVTADWSERELIAGNFTEEMFVIAHAAGAHLIDNFCQLLRASVVENNTDGHIIQDFDRYHGGSSNLCFVPSGRLAETRAGLVGRPRTNKRESRKAQQRAM